MASGLQTRQQTTEDPWWDWEGLARDPFGFMDDPVSAPPPTVPEPVYTGPEGAFRAGDYQLYPGVSFNNYGRASVQRDGTWNYFTPTVPDEYAGIMGVGGTPEEFYNFAQSFENGVIPASVRADLLQTAAAARDAEAGRQLALGRLGGAFDRVTGEQRGFIDDPERQAIRDMLMERATTDQFGAVERAAADRQLAAGSAVAEANAAAGTAQRGTAGGGLAASRQQSLEIQTVAAGQGLMARFDALNREANDRAGELLGRFETAGDQLELAYSHELTAIDTMISDLEGDVTLTEIDFLAYEAMEFGRQVYAANEAYQQASLEAFEKANEYVWGDVVGEFLDFLTAGGAGIIDSVFNISGGGGDRESPKPSDIFG